MDRVGIELSTVEVRFEELEIETSVFVGSRALPSVTNRFRDYAQAHPHPPSTMNAMFYLLCNNSFTVRNLALLKVLSGSRT